MGTLTVSLPEDVKVWNDGSWEENLKREVNKVQRERLWLSYTGEEDRTDEIVFELELDDETIEERLEAELINQ